MFATDALAKMREVETIAVAKKAAVEQERANIAALPAGEAKAEATEVLGNKVAIVNAEVEAATRKATSAKHRQAAAALAVTLLEDESNVSVVSGDAERKRNAESSQ